MAKANNQRAEDKATELKALSRSIFRPAIVWNKVCMCCIYTHKAILTD